MDVPFFLSSQIASFVSCRRRYPSYCNRIGQKREINDIAADRPAVGPRADVYTGSERADCAAHNQDKSLNMNVDATEFARSRRQSSLN